MVAFGPLPGDWPVGLWIRPAHRPPLSKDALESNFKVHDLAHDLRDRFKAEPVETSDLTWAPRHRMWSGGVRNRGHN